MEHTSSATALAVASGISANVDPVLAAEQVCEQVSARVEPGQVDLAVVFASGSHVEDMEQVTQSVGDLLAPATLIGVTSQGIVGTNEEIESQSGVSIFTASLPGTVLQSFTYRDLPAGKDNDTEALERCAEAIGAKRDLRATLFFADPFSVPSSATVEMLSGCADAVPGLKRNPVLGGVASGATKPGGNVLVLNGHAMRSGGIGVTIRGDVQVDTVVSQGCRPIGKPIIVTKAQRNVIQQLGGRRALDVLRDIVMALDPEEREMLPSSGMFVGRVINEYKSHFGRGDFLVRGVLGVDQRSGAIAVSDVVRTGQTVQFHVRDARTADEDLSMLLGAQRLQTPPAGGLLCTCNARGTALFGEAHHDARMISEQLAADDGTPMPLAGFFAAGEYGPIGGRSFLHGHTASLALFRPRPRFAAPPTQD